jgi:hypothetical protein
MRRHGILMLALSMTLVGWLPLGQAEPTPSSAVACYLVGRAHLNLNPDGTGQVQDFGYFTGITGISGSLFNGAPSESTAFFTYRTDVLSMTPVRSNGDIALGLGSAGTFDIYYNSSPNGDWSNPDTFSSGQLVARFARPEFLVLQILQSDSTNPPPFESITDVAVTLTLAKSQSFTFKGHKYDFRAIVPGGITVNEIASNTGVPGIAGFPIAQALAGHCLAVASEDRDQHKQ